MKKVCLLLAALILFLSFAGCGGYTSHYNAIGFVHSNESGSAFMNFYSFDGRMVFKLKNKNGSAGQLSYCAKLESGSAAVYIDGNGTKTELCAVHAGDAVEAAVDLSDSGMIYVIVETSETCMNGDFRFEVSDVSVTGSSIPT